MTRNVTLLCCCLGHRQCPGQAAVVLEAVSAIEPTYTCDTAVDFLVSPPLSTATVGQTLRSFGDNTDSLLQRTIGRLFNKLPVPMHNLWHVLYTSKKSTDSRAKPPLVKKKKRGPSASRGAETKKKKQSPKIQGLHSQSLIFFGLNVRLQRVADVLKNLGPAK